MTSALVSNGTVIDFYPSGDQQTYAISKGVVHVTRTWIVRTIPPPPWSVDVQSTLTPDLKGTYSIDPMSLGGSVPSVCDSYRRLCGVAE